jgi:hypothetical protein
MLDFDLIQNRIELMERTLQYQLETFYRDTHARIVASSPTQLYAIVRCSETPKPEGLDTNRVLHTWNFRDDISNHERMEIEAQHEMMLAAARDILKVFRTIPLFDHPQLSLDVRIHPRSGSGQPRVILCLDWFETHAKPLTLPKLMGQLRAQIHAIGGITPRERLAPWRVQDNLIYASTPAEAVLKYCAFRRPEVFNSDLEPAELPIANRQFSECEYRDDFISLLATTNGM